MFYILASRSRKLWSVWGGRLLFYFVINITLTKSLVYYG